MSFEKRTLQRCGVPDSGSLPPDPGPWVACLAAEYEGQRILWLSRLSGPSAEEARRPVEQHVALQHDLQSLGFLPQAAAVDGVYGDATRSAILAWQKAQGTALNGFLDNADSARLEQQAMLAKPLPESPAAPPFGTSASTGKVPIYKERIQFGRYAGATAFVVGSQGEGTTNASIQILMDWDREVLACSDEYLTYTPGEKNQDGYVRCISYAKEHFSGPEVKTARANCQTGEMWSFWASAPRFYVGQIRQTLKDGVDSREETYYDHVFEFEGFRIPQIGATNVGIDGDNFRRLCPVSFTGPPKTNLQDLDLSIDCNGELADAQRVATEVGVGHVLNIKIIDAWDVKAEPSSAYEANCSARIMFNTGERARLEYKKIPLHGKYFIQTRIVHY